MKGNIKLGQVFCCF